MTIQDILKEKNYTVYKLSKESGIPKSTLFDIFSGKSNLLDCRVRILIKIANTLKIDIKDLINLEPILYYPAFEENLPSFLEDSLRLVKDKRNKRN